MARIEPHISPLVIGIAPDLWRCIRLAWHERRANKELDLKRKEQQLRQYVEHGAKHRFESYRKILRLC